jgi:uncharacterized protein YfdQ (DUF2303 family)
MTIKELRGKLDNASMLLEDAAELIEVTPNQETSENEFLLTLRFTIEQAQEVINDLFYEVQDIDVTINTAINSLKEVLAHN